MRVRVPLPAPPQEFPVTGAVRSPTNKSTAHARQLGHLANVLMHANENKVGRQRRLGHYKRKYQMTKFWSLERTILILGPMGALMGILSASGDSYYGEIPAGAGYYAVMAILAGLLTRWSQGGWKTSLFAGAGVGVVGALGAPWEYLVAGVGPLGSPKREWFNTYLTFVQGWGWMGALMGLLGAALMRGLVERYGPREDTQHEDRTV